ncbi:MAG: DUF6166 domain-containing protein [Pseudomonadota bacterium]
MAEGHGKVYAGDRTIDGILVTVDGSPLEPRTDIESFSSLGFEWTYEGDEPKQLALAILADCLGDPARARSLCEGFMKRVIANLPNTWELADTDVLAVVAELE